VQHVENQSIEEAASRNEFCHDKEIITSSHLPRPAPVVEAGETEDESVIVFPLNIEITSFINIRHKIRPKTEPCGTIITISLTEEKQFSITTNCNLPRVKLDNHTV